MAIFTMNIIQVLAFVLPFQLDNPTAIEEAYQKDQGNLPEEITRALNASFEKHAALLPAITESTESVNVEVFARAVLDETAPILKRLVNPQGSMSDSDYKVYCTFEAVKAAEYVARTIKKFAHHKLAQLYTMELQNFLLDAIRGTKPSADATA